MRLIDADELMELLRLRKDSGIGTEIDEIKTVEAIPIELYEQVRGAEHQDVSPDYYGKDAEDLYYAIVCVEKYIKNAIPVEWLQKKLDKWKDRDLLGWSLCVKLLIEDWEKENARD